MGALTYDAIPSAGALTGGSASSRLLNKINDELGGSYFGGINDRLSDYRGAFSRNIAQPLIRAAKKIEGTIKRTLKRDRIVPCTSIETLASVPNCMIGDIVTYEPIRKLIKQGRVEGYGIDPEFLDGAEDVVGRLLANNTVDTWKEDAPVCDYDGDTFEFRSEYWSTDHDYTEEELADHEATREFIKKTLLETDLDPTSPYEKRG